MSATITVWDQPFTHQCGSWCTRAQRVPVRTSSMDDAEYRVEKIACLGYGEVVLSNGALRSSKDITPFYYGEEGSILGSDEQPVGFQVFHNIDGSTSNFSREGLIEVFRGNRDIWDGDLSDDDYDDDEYLEN